MEMDATLCYRALKTRDARFDGRFFTGVKTTGIYCRPVCPARTPKRENVKFYPCAAAAEEAGFRPCLRCRPEASPGTPAWMGTSATVSRALRLIGEGVLDEHGVDELARRLGVGARHLRRLFAEHLGATPISIAQTLRVQLAKKLIDETSLSLTEVAFSSGFSSIRRFNAAFRKTYRFSPSEMRRNGSSKRGMPKASDFRLKLTYRPPYDWDSLLSFLAARAIPGVEEVGEGVYRRTVSLDGRLGVIAVRHDEDTQSILLDVPVGVSRSLPQIAERVRRLFDLKADPVKISQHFKGDKVLGSVVQRQQGLRVPGAWDGFEVAVRAVLGQQVSVKGATTVSGRLVERYGEDMDTGTEDGLRYVFPMPERLAGARLNTIGITRARAQTIRGLARCAMNGDVTFSTTDSLETSVDSLTALPGIGPWTAHYVAMRVYSEPDAFPSGDLGLRKAATKMTGHEVGERELLEQAESWRPWRAYAAMHLWSTLSNGQSPGQRAPKKGTEERAS